MSWKPNSRTFIALAPCRYWQNSDKSLTKFGQNFDMSPKIVQILSYPQFFGSTDILQDSFHSSFYNPSPVVTWGTAFCQYQDETRKFHAILPLPTNLTSSLASPLSTYPVPLWPLLKFRNSGSHLDLTHGGARKVPGSGKFSFAQNWTDGREPWSEDIAKGSSKFLWP